jgi:hypothetical protein
VFLLGLAQIREYLKEPSGTFFLRQCLPYFFSSRCVFVGALARKYRNEQKAFPVDANFAFLPTPHFVDVTDPLLTKRVSKVSLRNHCHHKRAARRLWRWWQRDSATSAAAWRGRSGGGGSAKRGSSAQRDGGSAVAAARRLRRWRQHDSATLVAVWWCQRQQWQRLWCWQQRNSAILAVAAARQRNVGGSMAATAASAYSATAAARLQ